MSSTEVGSDAGADAAPARRAWSNPLLAFARASVLAAWTMYCYTACRISRMRVSDRTQKRVRSAEWTHRWLRGGAPLFGVRLTVEGSPPEGAALLAPNHLGYLDILAVGAACPTVFVSRAEVRSWPIMGHLFDMSEHIGITRSDRRSLTEVNALIAERLAIGQRVCVFLEGTSSNGSGLLPFHASLAQPAVETESPVVPISLRWQTDSDAVSIAEDVAYWRPEHNFVFHAWRALGLNGIHVTVAFGDPIPASSGDRKALAAKTREAITRMLESDPRRA